MNNLREQARAVGGDVLSHLGNHEFMNSIGIYWVFLVVTKLNSSPGDWR